MTSALDVPKKIAKKVTLNCLFRPITNARDNAVKSKAAIAKSQKKFVRFKKTSIWTINKNKTKFKITLNNERIP